jgi:hypothetical protein
MRAAQGIMMKLNGFRRLALAYSLLPATAVPSGPTPSAVPTAPGAGDPPGAALADARAHGGSVPLDADEAAPDDLLVHM